MTKKDKLFWIRVWPLLEEPVVYKHDPYLPKTKKVKESKPTRILSALITSTKTNIVVEGEVLTT